MARPAGGWSVQGAGRQGGRVMDVSPGYGGYPGVPEERGKADTMNIMGSCEVVFPGFCGVTKHKPAVARRQQDLDTPPMSGAAGDCRRPRSTQRWMLEPALGSDTCAGGH